jgi:hypothetical protein
MFIDSSIRDTVLVPIAILVVVVTFSRNFLIRLIAATPVVTAVEAAQRGVLARAQRLRAHGGYISPAGFYARKEHLAAAGTGVLLDEEVKDANPMMPAAGGGPAPSPFAMLEPMKPQLVFMASQFGVGMLISQFMTGFITLQLPFALTERFKSVTQSGIAAPGLSSSFVSASSWYYILCFGLPPLFRLLQPRSGGDASGEEARMMQLQMGMGMMGGGGAGPWMGRTMFKNEAGALGAAEWAPEACPMLSAEKELLDEAASLGLGGQRALPLALPVGNVRARIVGGLAERKKQ